MNPARPRLVRRFLPSTSRSSRRRRGSSPSIRSASMPTSSSGSASTIVRSSAASRGNARTGGRRATRAHRPRLTPGTAAQLALLGVTAIVTHPDALDSGRTARRPSGFWVPRVRLVPDAGRLVRVAGRRAARTGPRDTTPADSRIRLGDADRRRLSVHLTFGCGTIELTHGRPGSSGSPLRHPAGRAQTLRLADDTREIPSRSRADARLRVVDIPRGRSYVLVKTDPAATSESDAIVLSAATPTAAGRHARARGDADISRPRFCDRGPAVIRAYPSERPR